MNAVSTSESERVIDAREISPRVRHTVIFQVFEVLGDVTSMQFIVCHGPKPLPASLEERYGNRCRSTYRK